MSGAAYPARLEGRLDAPLSRWLWLFKWLLVIPHAIVLILLFCASGLLTVVAFFAILITGRYPRSIFDFNLGVLRWAWRVGFYAYSALGTDRYPPFSLGEEPDYPARLDIAYPERLSRPLVLVKWLLAIPHLLIVAILIGSGTWFIGESDWFAWSGGLLEILVLIAGFALLLTARYPQQLFDLVLGFNRWILRVAAYVGLMTDRYPPFRLDMGGADGGQLTFDETGTIAAPAAAAPRGPVRTAAIIGAAIATLIGLALLVAGAGALWVDANERDADGFVMSDPETYATSTYALASEEIDTLVDGPGDFGAQDLFGTARIRVRSEQPVFTGIATRSDVDALLAGTSYEVIGDLANPADDRTLHRGSSAPPDPTASDIWVASVAGAGTQTLDWDVRDGTWSVVVMNADGSRGVQATAAVGAELSDLDTLGWVLVGGAVLLLATAAGLLVFALRNPAR
jgi:hypothetical protein